MADKVSDARNEKLLKLVLIFKKLDSSLNSN